MGQVESGVAIDGSTAVTTFFSGSFRDGRSSFSVRGLSGCGCLMSSFDRVELARRGIPDDRSKPVRDIQMTARMRGSGPGAKCWSNSDKTTDRCEYGEHCERHPH